MKNEKIKLTLEDGRIVDAQAPLIVSASRATDIPAFYSDWFFNRLSRDIQLKATDRHGIIG